mmetsp:Transcript_47/g.54  ORF Transcript_47/g.54 Transcript_47/m.54 type:complete len:99 (-) Transcript_47:21-317(-)
MCRSVCGATSNSETDIRRYWEGCWMCDAFICEHHQATYCSSQLSDGWTTKEEINKGDGSIMYRSRQAGSNRWSAQRSYMCGDTCTIVSYHLLTLQHVI